jgi:hypothetical protein
MSRKNWDAVAQQEFDNLDAEEKASFADLRERVERGSSDKWHFSSLWGS